MKVTTHNVGDEFLEVMKIEYIGHTENPNMYWFLDCITKSSVCIPAADLTEGYIRKKVNKSRLRFGLDVTIKGLVNSHILDDIQIN